MGGSNMSAKSEAVEMMVIPVPLVMPLGWPLKSKKVVEEVWDVFVKPEQERGNPPSIEMRCLVAILRAVWEGMPEE
jgi:hypothetical protein